MITTVLAFILTLGVLVVVHEYGHYRVAVACGVKVLRFSVGFGRVLLRWKRGRDATEFVVCALPFGGYVRMLDEREAPVAPQEAARAFNRQPLLRRAAIVAAGPVANLLLAVVLYASAHWIGISEPQAVVSTPAAGSVAEAAGLRAGDWVRASARQAGVADAAEADWRDVESMTDLRWVVTQAALHGDVLQLRVTDRQGHGARNVRLDLSRFGSRDIDAALMKQIGIGPAYSEPRLGDVKAGGPAAAAGLQRGDRIVSIGGAPVADAQALVDSIRSSVPGGIASPQRWMINRGDTDARGDSGGRDIVVTLTPRVARDGDRNDRPIGRIDAVVGQPPAMLTVRHGPVEGLVQGVSRTWEVSALTVRMMGRMLVGDASLKNISGPLTIADYAGQSVHQGLAYYLGFLALVSVSLGVLNLLPLPMLDGGHLMYYIFEALTGRPPSDVWLGRLQRGGIALLLMMMSVALFNDVARLLGQ